MCNCIQEDDGCAFDPPKKTIHQGWECPKCHSIWSPDEKKCTTCEPPKNEGVGGREPQLLVE